MLLLPTPLRRARLLSFWFVISVSTGLLVGGLLSFLISPGWFGLGVVLGLGSALLGVRWWQAISVVYNFWNRMVRFYMRVARVLLKGICFYIILVPVAQIGSFLRLAPASSTKSLWVPRETLAPTAYSHQHYAATEASAKRRWISTYLSWTVKSRNLWAVCLLPFLVLLSAVETEERTALPTNIYTLY